MTKRTEDFVLHENKNKEDQSGTAVNKEEKLVKTSSRSSVEREQPETTTESREPSESTPTTTENKAKTLDPVRAARMSYEDDEINDEMARLDSISAQLRDTLNDKDAEEVLFFDETENGDQSVSVSASDADFSTRSSEDNFATASTATSLLKELAPKKSHTKRGGKKNAAPSSPARTSVSTEQTPPPTPSPITSPARAGQMEVIRAKNRSVQQNVLSSKDDNFMMTTVGCAIVWGIIVGLVVHAQYYLLSAEGKVQVPLFS